MTPICLEPDIKVPPIGNGLWGIEWSRDRCRHMTPKGQTRDPQYA